LNHAPAATAAALATPNKRPSAHREHTNSPVLPPNLVTTSQPPPAAMINTKHGE